MNIFLFTHQYRGTVRFYFFFSPTNPVSVNRAICSLLGRVLLFLELDLLYQLCQNNSLLAPAELYVPYDAHWGVEYPEHNRAMLSAYILSEANVQLFFYCVRDTQLLLDLQSNQNFLPCQYQSALLCFFFLLFCSAPINQSLKNYFSQVAHSDQRKHQIYDLNYEFQYFFHMETLFQCLLITIWGLWNVLYRVHQQKW